MTTKTKVPPVPKKFKRPNQPNIDGMAKARAVREKNVQVNKAAEPPKPAPAPAFNTKLEVALKDIVQQIANNTDDLESASERRAILAADLMSASGVSKTRQAEKKSEAAELDTKIDKLIETGKRLPDIKLELERRLVARAAAEKVAKTNDAKKELKKKLVAIQAASKKLLSALTDAAGLQLHLNGLWSQYNMIKKTNGNITIELKNVTSGSELIGIIREVIFAEAVENQNKRPQAQVYRI